MSSFPLLGAGKRQEVPGEEVERVYQFNVLEAMLEGLCLKALGSHKKVLSILGALLSIKLIVCIKLQAYLKSNEVRACVHVCVPEAVP